MVRKFKCLSNQEVVRRNWGYSFRVGEIYEEGDAITYGLGSKPSDISYFLKYQDNVDGTSNFKYVDRECFELVCDNEN